MNQEPLYDQVVIKPNPVQTKSAGGIAIPQDQQEKPSIGVVIAVGAGIKDRPMAVKVGYTAFYIKGAGVPFVEESELYLIMKDTSILMQSKEG